MSAAEISFHRPSFAVVQMATTEFCPRKWDHFPSVHDRLKGLMACVQPSTGRASLSMRRDPRVLLADIDRAGADIGRFTAGMDSSVYAGDALTQVAVERKFEIIGEALNRLQKAHPELAERVPRLRRIIDFRNLLIHGVE